jgi:hypothetical protein
MRNGREHEQPITLKRKQGESKPTQQREHELQKSQRKIPVDDLLIYFNTAKTKVSTLYPCPPLLAHSF